MDEKLIKSYLKYKNSQTEQAVLFVGKYIRCVKRFWVEILSCRYIKKDEYLYYFYDFSINNKNMLYKSVTCNLYNRRIQPEYPIKPDEECDEKTRLWCNAITWNTAKKDIEQQKKDGKKFLYWRIELKRPEMFLFKYSYNFSKTINWKKVPEELKSKMSDEKILNKIDIYNEILSKYTKDPGIFKNNKVEYTLYRDRVMLKH